MKTKVAACTVRVPATTANLGPGFDALGVALKFYNRVTVRLAEPAEPPSPMFAQSAAMFFEAAGIAARPVDVRVAGDVPISRGLGSSVTVRLGILVGLNALHRRPLARERLLELAAHLEHHPDNAAPALLGGFVVSAMEQGRGVRVARFAVASRLKFVAVVPGFETETEKARELLPQQVALRDAVHNLNRTALITAAFASRDYEALRGVFDDRLHQPYRKVLIPQLDDVIAAGVRAGALGGWLSGSGSTVMCVTLRNAAAAARAMATVFRQQNIPAAARVLTADNDGARVLA